MKTIYFFLLLALPLFSRAQVPSTVGIGTTAPNSKAALDISSTDKGLLIPRISEAQRLAMGNSSTLPAGLMVFQTDGAAPGFWYFFGGQWLQLPNDQQAATTASNGLSKAGSAVQLGGALTQPTTIAAGTRPLTVSSWPGTFNTATVVPDANNPPTWATDISLGTFTQSFTVQQTGGLRTVGVNISPLSNFTGLATLRLEVVGPLPATTTLTTATTATGPGGIATFTINTPLPVQAGEQYQLRVSRQTSNGVVFVYVTGDQYPGGALNVNGFDLVFNTGIYLPMPDVPSLTVQSGKLGIGTSTPQALLHVAGAARIDGLAGTGTRMVTTDASGNLNTSALPTDAQQLAINGSTISLTSGGSVTVPSSADNLGNHTATEPLKYNANDGDKIYFLAQGSTGPKLAHGSGWTLDYHAGPNNSNNGLHRFFTGSSTGWQERLRIANNGNVGVGTTNPQATLDVDGTVRLGPQGTVLRNLQTGKATMGNCGSNTCAITITFPAPFATTPNVLLTPAAQPNTNFWDTFAASVRWVTPTQVRINVSRVDEVSSWGQNLTVTWMAW